MSSVEERQALHGAVFEECKKGSACEDEQQCETESEAYQQDRRGADHSRD
jgi:hypothetical protein